MAEFHSICTSFTEMFAANDWKTFQSCWAMILIDIGDLCHILQLYK
jgi:hypothetical protein